MPNDFYGLPLHPLIVHATVVMIPLAALTVLLSALWPRFRAWAGPLPAGISLIGLVLVPLSTSTGETLEKHVARSALLEEHTRLADGLLPWMIGLFAVSVIGYAIHWRSTHGHSMHRAIAVVVAVLAVVAVVGTTVQVARIGHSGAKAAWADTDMSSTSRP
ncbi:DUF2231 domain-containing protein [Aeromicrobium fastidiosum]|uniref:DUF2231 domain-containing protein n=1 Tax=Aeromicrobium fastidiosum TaxID=52699 RepID=A0A641ARA7_9ACTN|nr:DUF2231 domain-containing protein [Aeromicrobium fastidiosum]KAA1378612.1 hypothetical protein ESP62_009735 [Aeromicrobium fastidiosum]MBP2392409.1 hypothetical protein [Aeromicrobium fastidiosum]